MLICDAQLCDHPVRTVFDAARKRAVVEAMVEATQLPQLRNASVTLEAPRKLGNLPADADLWACPDAGPEAKHVLFLTRSDFVNTCVLVRLTGTAGPAAGHTLVHLGFADDLFDGTALYGDLVCLRGTWTFAVEDVLSVAGNALVDDPAMDLHARTALVRRLLDESFVPDAQADAFRVDVKHFEPARSFAQLGGGGELGPFGWLSLKHAGGLRQACRRQHVWRVPSSAGPEAHRGQPQRATVALKPRAQARPRAGAGAGAAKGRAFDRRLVATAPADAVRRLLYLQSCEHPDVYHLYESASPADATAVGHAAVQTLQKSRWMRGLFKGGSSKRLLMRCDYDVGLQKWEPMEVVGGIRAGAHME